MSGQLIVSVSGIGAHTRADAEAFCTQLDARGVPVSLLVAPRLGGDYRLESVMFHPTEPKLIAVLDWELSTIGHPLADIAYNAFLWRSDSPSWGSLQGVDFATSGIPTEQQYVDAYLKRVGRGPVEDWNFYVSFSVFRLASISQGVYRRVLAGVAASTREAVNGTPHLAKQALDILHGRL